MSFLNADSERDCHGTTSNANIHYCLTVLEDNCFAFELQSTNLKVLNTCMCTFRNKKAKSVVNGQSETRHFLATMKHSGENVTLLYKYEKQQFFY